MNKVLQITLKEKIRKGSLIIFALFYFVIASFRPSPALAEGNPFIPTTDMMQTGLTPMIGGGSLYTASQNIANFTDIAGAYYDSTLDRIVFIGTTGGTSPKFNKDDMAVAIRSVFFNGTLPNVSIDDDPSNPSGPNAVVTYTGPIKNTNLGSVLFNSDYKLKQYVIGYDPSNIKLTSTVPSYKSVVDRYVALNPNPISGNQTKFILSPQAATLKNATAEKAFVFTDLSMQVTPQHINPANDVKWNQAASDFANDITTNYDQYAQESTSLAQAKQVAKIVAILKWISDKNIPTDLYWAQNYTAQTVSTPTTVQKVKTPVFPNGYSPQGQVSFNTPNTYVADDGIAASLKSSSQAVSTSKEDVAWTFTNGGQQYQAVAVSADSFKSLGGFSTSSIDIGTPIAGDFSLNFQRSYSSFSNAQFGIGIGWDLMPASVYPNSVLQDLDVVTCNDVLYFTNLAIDTSNGHETFTFSCPAGYSPDHPSFHSKLVQNTDESFTLTSSDQTRYLFNSDFQLKTIQDKNGNKINYSYDTAGKLTNIADTKNHQLTLSYTSQNLISQIADWGNRKVEYLYDPNGRLTGVKDPNGNTTNYAYDSSSRLTTITDRTGAIVLTNTYNPDGRIATQKNAAGLTKANVFDAANKQVIQTDSNNRIIKTTYDANSRILQQTDPADKSIIYTYGTESVPLTETDRNGKKTTYAYDSSGNLTSVTFPDNAVVTYTYNTGNRITKILDGRYGSPNKQTDYSYDAVGNLVQKTDAGVITKYTYDSIGEVASYTDQLNNTTSWTRDSLGNMLTEVDPNGKVTSYEYDALGRRTKITDANNIITSSTYDANGNIKTITDAYGAVTTTYDKENNLVSVKAPNNTITQYTYNPSGSVVSVIDALNNTTTYGYDSYQNLLTQKNALNNTTTSVFNNLDRQISSTTPLGKITSWQYDANGNITQQVDAKNNSINYQYDSMNRLTKITYPDAKTVTYQYDNRGNLTSMIDSNGTFTYVFDNFDRMTKATNPNGQTIQYAYDNANNLTQLTYPDGKLVKYAYDKNQRMTTITDWNNKVITYTYSNNGNVATRAYPNGMTTYYTYDSANRLSVLEHKQGTTSRAKFALARSNIGNIIFATQSGNLVQAQTNPYAYDNLGRLTSSTLYDSNAQTYTYAYDAVGNITRSKNWFSDITNVYDADNKLITSDGRTQLYDNNGNLTKRVTNQTRDLVYDFENRLIQYDSDTYKYDGLGNRLFSSSPNVRYVNDISGPVAKTLADYDLTFNKFKYYHIYGFGSSPVAQYVNTGGSTIAARYYIEDAFGNTRWMTSSSGGTTATLRYDPYGNFTYTQYLPPTYLFSGQKYDQESGLTYIRARYYDPTLGRFISRDSNPGNLRNPLSQNAYMYGYGDPVNLADDSGKNPLLKLVLQKAAEKAGPLLDKGTNAGKALFRLLNGDGDPTNEIKAAQAANDIKIGKHILKDLSRRGWTKDLIKKTIQKPARKVTTKDIRNKPDGSGRVDDPATAYIREDGSYVVRNDKTGDIVQISNRNDPNWKSPW